MALKYATTAGDWHTAVNWNGGTLPAAGDTVYLNNKAMTAAADIDLSPNPDVAATAMIVGCLYEIKTVGNTVWTGFGAPDNNVGTVFFCTLAGTGTGVATARSTVCNNVFTSPAITKGGTLVFSVAATLAADLIPYGTGNMVTAGGAMTFNGTIRFGRQSSSGYALYCAYPFTQTGDILGGFESITTQGNGLYLTGVHDNYIAGNIRGCLYTAVSTYAVYLATSGQNLTVVGDVEGGYATSSNSYACGINYTGSPIGGNVTITGTVRGNGGKGIQGYYRNVVINGDCIGGDQASAAAVDIQYSTLIVTGNVTGGTGSNSAHGVKISNTYTTPTVVTGTVTGGSGSTGLFSTGDTVVNGDVYGGVGPYAGVQVSHLPASTFTITGNAYASERAPAIAYHFTSGFDGAMVIFNGNEYDHASGACAISVFRRKLGTDIGSIRQISLDGVTLLTRTTNTTDAMPAIADVRAGTVYANSGLTGTLVIPSAESVAKDVPFDNTVGTGIITAATLRAELSSELERLMNCATVDSTGAQIVALS